MVPRAEAYAVATRRSSHADPAWRVDRPFDGDQREGEEAAVAPLSAGMRARSAGVQVSVSARAAATRATTVPRTGEPDQPATAGAARAPGGRMR